MADTQAPAGAPKARNPNNFVIKSSVNIKSAGNPQKAVNADGVRDGDEVLVSTVFGIAQGTNRRANPNGVGDMVGLTGMFSCMPTDPDRPEVRGRICYLPDGIQDPIMAALAAAHEKDENAVVRFAVENYAQKGGTAGFTWIHKPIFDGAGGVVIDPLAGIRDAVVAGVKALPGATAQEKAQVAATPPVREFGGEKKPAAAGTGRK